MKAVITHYTSAIWLLLLFLTLGSWYLGEHPDMASGFDIRVVTPVLLVVAFFKARLVGLHFMELKTAQGVLDEKSENLYR